MALAGASLRPAGCRGGPAMAAAAAAPTAPPPPAAARLRPMHAGLRQRPALQATAVCRRSMSGLSSSRSSSSGSWLLQPPRPRQQQQRRSAPRAAAGGDAAPGSAAAPPPPPPPPPPQPLQQQPKRKPREMSMQQRWRAAKFAVQEWAQQLSKLPAVAAALAALAALRARLQPVVDVWLRYKKWEEGVLESYNEFIADETKRQWSWSKRYAQELAWWANVPPFLGFFAATVLYQCFMPVSFLAAVAVPLYYSWVLWDAWWRSPVFLATLLMTPLKWVPWAEMCLVWPGLI